MRFWPTALGPRGRSLYGSRSLWSKSISKCVRLVEGIVPVFFFFSDLLAANEDCCDCDCGVGDGDAGRGEDACDDTGVSDFEVGVETWLSLDENPRVPCNSFVVGLRTRWDALDGDGLSGSTALCGRFETRV
jgi:hypothetical protein